MSPANSATNTRVHGSSRPVSVGRYGLPIHSDGPAFLADPRGRHAQEIGAPMQLKYSLHDATGVVTSRGPLSGRPIPPLNQNQRELFWAKVQKTDTCWLWTARSCNGYGSFGIGRVPRLAHRVAYTELVGPIPKGMTLDHLCRVRACVNPAHLEVVTAEENVRRAMPIRTHCENGHELPEAGIKDRTRCRICKPWATRAGGAPPPARRTTCKICGESLPPPTPGRGRPRLFCSERCKKASYKAAA